MATYTSNTSKGYQLRLTVIQASQDTVNNKSYVNWSLSLHNGSNTIDRTGQTVRVILNGMTVYNQIRKLTLTTYNSSLVLASGTNLEVPHNDDGKKTLSCSFQWTPDNTSLSYMPNESLVGSGNLPLTDIPRKSTATVPGGTYYFGDNVPIALSKASSSFYHRINVFMYKPNGTFFSYWIENASLTGNSVNITANTTWFSQLGDVTSGKLEFDLHTYTNAACTISVGYNRYSTTVFIKPPTFTASTYTGDQKWLYCGDGTVASNINLNVTTSNVSTWDRVTCTINGSAEITVFESKPNTAKSKVYTHPISHGAYFPNTKNAKIVYRLYSWNNNALISSSQTITKTMWVNEDTVKPTVTSLTMNKYNTLNNWLVSGKSYWDIFTNGATVHVASGAKLSYVEYWGYNLTSTKVTVLGNGVSIAPQSVTADTTINYYARVIDSRGFISSTVQVSSPLYRYKPLILSNVDVFRTATSSSTTEVSDGTYVRFNLSGQVDFWWGYNKTLSVDAYWKESSSNSYNRLAGFPKSITCTTPSDTTSYYGDYSLSQTFSSGNWDTEKSYSVRMIIKDFFETQDSISTIGTSGAIIDIDISGTEPKVVINGLVTADMTTGGFRTYGPIRSLKSPKGVEARLMTDGYLTIKGWEGYGEGNANIWYDANSSRLKYGTNTLATLDDKYIPPNAVNTPNGWYLMLDDGTLIQRSKTNIAIAANTDYVTQSLPMPFIDREYSLITTNYYVNKGTINMNTYNNIVSSFRVYPVDSQTNARPTVITYFNWIAIGRWK